MKKKSTIIILLLIVFCNWFGIELATKFILELNLNFKIPENSANWNLSGILIDDTNPNSNWSKIEIENDWCEGSGTWNDPYVIENVTIIGASANHCIEIRNSIVPFIIKNCIFQNPGEGSWVNGIMLNNTNNGLILNNTCSFNFGVGILLSVSENNTVSSNFLDNNQGTGIYLASSNNNTIINNICRNHEDSGIFIFRGNSNRFIGNQIDNSREAITNAGTNNILRGNIMDGCGIHVRSADSYDYSGIFNEISTHTIDNTNLVNGKPVYYYVNMDYLQNVNISNAGQIIIIDCSHSNFVNLNISNSNLGVYIFGGNNNTVSDSSIQNIREEAIYLHFSSNNKLISNRLWNNRYGVRCESGNSNNISNNRIYTCNEGVYIKRSNLNYISECYLNYNYRGMHLDESDSNIVENCVITHNDDWGIAIPFGGNDASNNIIRRNLIQFNGEYGIRIQYDEPVNNLIYLNYFVENKIDAYDFGTNTQWDNGTIGNYWYDYSGVDGNSDGIGDTPYNFGTGFDLYPIYRERPNIAITSPLFNERFNSPPNFNIEVSGSDLDKIWYSLNDGTNIYLIQESGTIDLTAWNALQDGDVTIRFYINDSFGIYNYEEVVIVKDTSDNILITSIIIGLLAAISISSAGIIVWKRKFSGRSLYVKSPEKIKLVKKKLLELGTQFEHLRVGEIAERCGVLEGTAISILKEMIKNKEIYAKYYKTESLVTFDQQLITEEIDQLMETYRNWEKKTFGKKLD